VLTNTWGAPDPRLDALLAHWSSLAEQGDGRNLLASIALSCLSPGFVSAEPEAFDELRATEPPRLDGFVAAAAACRGHDALVEVAAIAQPALVIAGEQDTFTPPELSAQLAARLANAEMASLDAGHSSFVERPGEWLEVVRQFLKS
jgi:3-oxoadipate enol-lactonase